MRFPFAIPPKYPGIERPFLDVTLIKGRIKIPVGVIVDSGADYCTFDRDVGESLGIDIATGRPSTMTGIGNIEYPIFFHRIKMNINGHDFSADVCFTQDCDIPPIPVLGQEGFFDKFTVFFNYPERYFEIEPYPVLDDPWPTP